MTRRALLRHRAAVVLMVAAIGFVAADVILDAHQAGPWRWITVLGIGTCATLALHLRGWAAGYEAAQPQPTHREGRR